MIRERLKEPVAVKKFDGNSRASISNGLFCGKPCLEWSPSKHEVRGSSPLGVATQLPRNHSYFSCTPRVGVAAGRILIDTLRATKRLSIRGKFGGPRRAQLSRFSLIQGGDARGDRLTAGMRSPPILRVVDGQFKGGSMARIRSVKPEYASDGKILRLSDSCALFFVLMWAHCDDQGYFNPDPLELSSKLSRWRSQEVSKFLSTLARADLVKISSSLQVGLVVGWEHQRIDKPRLGKWHSMEIQWDAAEPPQEDSGNPPRKERRGEEGKGEERKGASPGAPPPVAEPPTKAAWEAYAKAYHKRYGSKPVRNATINGQLAGFVKRLGKEEGPSVAAFYVTHNDQFYVRSLHPVGLLLRDAEKLRTEWITGLRMTQTKAAQTDRRDATASAFVNLIEESEAQYGAG